MKTRRLSLLFCLLSLFISDGSLAFYDQPLNSLTENQMQSLKDFSGKILLVSLFEPDCRWCLKQMKVLNRISQECTDALQPLAVGIHGQKTALKRELHRARVQFPALQASPSWLQSIGEVPATPWTLVVDTQGKLITTLRGYFEFEKIQNAFPQGCTQGK